MELHAHSRRHAALVLPSTASTPASRCARLSDAVLGACEEATATARIGTRRPRVRRSERPREARLTRYSRPPAGRAVLAGIVPHPLCHPPPSALPALIPLERVLLPVSPQPSPSPATTTTSTGLRPAPLPPSPRPPQAHRPTAPTTMAPSHPSGGCSRPRPRPAPRTSRLGAGRALLALLLHCAPLAALLLAAAPARAYVPAVPTNDTAAAQAAGLNLSDTSTSTSSTTPRATSPPASRTSSSARTAQASARCVSPAARPSVRLSRPPVRRSRELA